MAKNNLLKGSVFNKMMRWTLIMFSIITIFILTVSVLFVINKDKISSYLLNATNNLTQGEVTFDGISINPFVQFPTVSLTLNHVTYFEKKSDNLDSLILPIATLSTIHAGINIRELTRGNISISAIAIENGTFDLVTYTDSSLNLINAFKAIIKDSCVTNPSKNKVDTISQTKFNLYLEKIQLHNIVLNYTNQLKGNYTSIKITDLASSLSITNDTILAAVNTQLVMQKIPFDPFKSIKNLNISIQSSVSFNTNTKYLLINKSAVSIRDAVFNTNGWVSLGDAKNINLLFDGSDTDMSFFNMILKPMGVKNIKSGDIYFKGKVKGNFDSGIPRITCNFGIKNLNVLIPKNPFFVSDLNIKGSFNSGTSSNFTAARLKIDTLSAILPNGYATGRFMLSNFKNPALDYFIELKTNLTGFSSLFKAKKLENIKGNIAIKSEFKGHFMKNMASVKASKSNTEITLDSVSFKIPNMDFKYLNGTVSGNLDTLCFNNLSALIGNSDIKVDGIAYNASNLVLRSKSDVVANLHVTSQLFDLADFLITIPSVGRGFPYQMLNLESKVSFKTNRQQLFSKHPGPHFTIENSETNVTINNMLPPVKLLDGTFIMGDSIGDQLLTFNDFNISFNGGALKANVVYHSPSEGDRSVAIKTEVIDFNTGKLIYYKADSIPKSMDALLNGYATCNLSFPSDTNLMFSEILLDANNLTYQTDSDTYTIGEIQLHAHNTNYNTHVIKNPLSTLSSHIDLMVSDLTSNHLNIGKASSKFSITTDTCVRFDYIAFNANDLMYKTDSDTTNMGLIRLNANKTEFNTTLLKNPLATLTSQFDLELIHLKSKHINLNHIALNVIAKNGAYAANSTNRGILEKEGKGFIYITPFRHPIKLKFNYKIEQFEAKTLLKIFNQEEFIEGKLNLLVNIDGEINSADSLFNDLTGKIELSGKDLIITGINIDEFLKKVEKTQNFNLVDAGAFMIAGPVGLVVTKGTAVTQVFLNDKNSKSDIIQLKSSFDVNDGLFSVADMALASKQNRIASKGWINMNSKELLLEFAVVDPKGCSKISQKISGSINKPKVSDLEVFSSLLAPVTNLYDNVVNTDCTPFYTGSVEHPKPEK